MPATVERECKNRKCRKRYIARVADVKRGWGLHCSKSCAATTTNKRTGNFSKFINRRNAAISSERFGNEPYEYEDANGTHDDTRPHGDL